MFDSYSLLIDYSIMSGLLLMAQFIRSKSKILQNFYIPFSLIAGFVGLILGPQILNVINWSSEASSYPYSLICIIFGAIFIGKKIEKVDKNILKKVGDTFFINTGSETLCFGISLLFGGCILAILFPKCFPELSLLLQSGFAGGHGYAAAIGGSLNELLNRDDCVFIGQVFATIGLLAGLIGGIICINYAAKRGYTRFVGKAVKLSEETRKGFISLENQENMGKNTTHSMSIDSLAWHISLIMIAFGIGYALKQFLDSFFPSLQFPLMCLPMLAGLLIQHILKIINHDIYVDKKVIDKCSGCMTDYLVAFGIATIKISVIEEFWAPILVLCIIGIVWPLIVVFVLSKRLFHNFWFERSIFIYGYLTGIIAVGMTLLRCCDPDAKSETLNDFGYAYTIQSIIEILLVTLTPIATVRFGWFITGLVVTVLGIIFIVLCKILFGSQKEKGDVLRDGESDIIGGRII